MVSFFNETVKIILKQYRIDLLAILSLCATAPLFFYKLGQSSLVSWDEAWYADVARNILQTGEPLRLMWNGAPFFDHPPAGFWLTALTFKLFGVSEFWARFPSAVEGLASLVVVYLIGKELFSRTVGFASAVALCSSLWFLYRARSGNLDIALTMFFLLTLLLALRAAKNKAYLIPFAVSLALLFLSKILVPVTIVPALAIIFFRAKNLHLKDFLAPGLIFLFLAGSWFAYQFSHQPTFLTRLVSTGLPGMGVEASYLENILRMKEYLHSGVGKWFWPGVGSLILGLFLKKRGFYILSVFFFVFFIPSFFSSRSQIWHVIPLHPILILSFFGTAYFLMKKMIKQEKVIVVTLLAVSFYFSFLQIKRMWYQFINIPAFVTDEAILAGEAGKYKEPFMIDEDFVPAAIFYSGKHVDKVWEGGIGSLFAENKPFLLITRKWRLDQAKIPVSEYRIIKADRDKLLVKRVIND